MTSPLTLTNVQYIEISPSFSGQRIDNFLKVQLKGIPKSLIYRLLRTGEIRVNKGRIKPEYKLQQSDVIRLPPMRIPDKKEQDAFAIPLLDRLESAIIYEDNKLLVVNKPAGLAVHGGSGLSYGLIEAFRQLRPEAKELELVHRLDRDTSGLLMIAKRRSMLRYLHEQLRGDGIDKRYLALVKGYWPTAKKTIAAPLLKNNLRSGERVVEINSEGKEAVTEFKVIKRFDDFATLIEAKPITGRTHQIRVHTKYAGHVIAGDSKYGDNNFTKAIRALGGKRLFLHAYHLNITLPDHKRLNLEAPPETLWQNVLERLNAKI